MESLHTQLEIPKAPERLLPGRVEGVGGPGEFGIQIQDSVAAAAVGGGGDDGG